MKQKFEDLGKVLSKGDAKRIVGASGCFEQCLENTNRCNFYRYCGGACDANPAFCCNIYCNSQQPE